MTQPITVKKRTYLHFGQLAPSPAGAGAAWPGPIEDRGFMSPKRKVLNLKQSYGVYLPLGGRDILFVIDATAVRPGSADWAFIHEIATILDGSFAKLDAQAKAALGFLEAVVFARAPDRSFARVREGRFFYDTDEFRRSDGSPIRAAYAASNVVHDANHVWLFKNRRKFAGDKAEVICWQLQVDNKDALGLDQHEVTHLKKLIANPSVVKDRIEQKPL